jgi:hypothetical protein
VLKLAVVLALGLAAACLLVSGCGGGDGKGSSDQAAPIAKAAFVKKADAICQASRRSLIVRVLAALREGKAAGSSRHEIETAAVATILIPTLRAEVEDLRQLGAPSGDEEEIGELLDAMQKPIEEARTDPQSYVQYGGHYRPGSYHYGEVSRLASRYGLTDCPQG